MLILAALLRLWGLARTGYGNPYYSATVRSMAASWHNFFFASFDPSGYLSIDKPPVAFWIQTGAVHLFGFHPFALLLPSAVAGVAGVGLLFVAVRRVFGTGPATVAALVLALTPISVATDRFNDPDSVMTFLLLLAAWLVVRAAETGSWRRLAWAGAVVGLACLTKSLAAVLPVPGLGLAYLTSPSGTFKARISHLAVATVVLVAVGVSWVIVVDAVPAGSRPLVAGTSADSELSLLFGSNGLSRVNGTSSTPGLPPAAQKPGAALAAIRYGDTGTPGLLRLIDSPLGGQAGWALAVGITGLVAAAVDIRRRRDPRLASLWLWGGWLAAEAVVLSAASGVFHAYYLSALAPAAAALAGIGTFALVDAWKGRRWTAALVPVAVIGTGLIEWRALAGFVAFAGLGTSGLLLAVLAGALLCASVVRPRLQRIARLFTAAAMAVACIAAVTFTASVLRHPGVAQVPIAGPALDGPGAALAKAQAAARHQDQPFDVVNSPANPGGAATGRLIAFLQANRHNERWVLAMPTGLDAAPIITRSGLAVVALAGIDNAPVATVGRLQQLISTRQLRFALVAAQPTGLAGLVHLEAWALQSCVPVPTADWVNGPPQPSVLVDCAPATAPVVPAGLG